MNPSEQAANDPYMINLEDRYMVERNNRQELLKLEENKFANLNFVREADAIIKAMGSKSNEEKEIELQKAIDSLKLPSEMIADVIENPLHFDEEASIAFLGLYRDKVYDLIAVYNGILWEYREDIENFEVQPYAQKEDVLMFSTKLPIELKMVIDSMRKQSIQLCMNKITGEISACYYNSPLHETMVYQFHGNTSLYTNMLVNESYFNGGGMKLTLWNSVQYLNSIQYMLPTVMQDTKLYPVIQSHFITLLIDIIKGTETMQVFDDQRNCET